MKAKPTTKELGWNTVNLVHRNQIARHNTTARRNITAMARHSTTGGTTKKSTSKMVTNDMSRRLDRRVWRWGFYRLFYLWCNQLLSESETWEPASYVAMLLASHWQMPRLRNEYIHSILPLNCFVISPAFVNASLVELTGSWIIQCKQQTGTEGIF